MRAFPTKPNIFVKSSENQSKSERDSMLRRILVSTFFPLFAGQGSSFLRHHRDLDPGTGPARDDVGHRSRSGGRSSKCTEVNKATDPAGQVVPIFSQQNLWWFGGYFVVPWSRMKNAHSHTPFLLEPVSRNSAHVC